MKKALVIIIILVIAVVVVGGVYLMMQNNQTLSMQPATNETPVQPVTQNTQPTDTSADSVTSTSVEVETSPVKPATTPKPTTPSSSTNSGTIVLKTAISPVVGTYITAANDMSLYTYDKDTPGISNCTGPCLSNWPPYFVSSASGLKADSKITGSLGTIASVNGKLQLTYKGMPLYFWAQDIKPGDVTGDNVNSFFVAKP